MSRLNPQVTTIEGWTSAGIRQVVTMAELKDVFPAAFQKVATEVAMAGGKLTGPAYARYFGMPTETVDLEIGFGVEPALEAPSLVVTDNPAMQAVVGTHYGPYDQLESSYGELMQWLAGQNLALADWMLEFYDSTPETPAEETITRLVFPLA